MDLSMLPAERFRPDAPERAGGPMEQGQVESENKPFEKGKKRAGWMRVEGGPGPRAR